MATKPTFKPYEGEEKYIFVSYAHKDDEKVNNFNAERMMFIRLKGEWIFYFNGSNGGRLYKIRTDGTERQLVD